MGTCVLWCVCACVHTHAYVCAHWAPCVPVKIRGWYCVSSYHTSHLCFETHLTWNSPLPRPAAQVFCVCLPCRLYEIIAYATPSGFHEDAGAANPCSRACTGSPLPTEPLASPNILISKSLFPANSVAIQELKIEIEAIPLKRLNMIAKGIYCCCEKQ